MPTVLPLQDATGDPVLGLAQQLTARRRGKSILAWGSNLRKHLVHGPAEYGKPLHIKSILLAGQVHERREERHWRQQITKVAAVLEW